MEFLISESQLKLILQEQDKSKMSSYLRKLYSFTSDIVSKSGKKFGLNLKLLLTWGASVGGLVLPLSNYIDTGNFNLDDNQKALILVGVASVLYFDNKGLFDKVYKIIKKEKLEKQFNKILDKGSELRLAFFNFLESLNLSFRTMGELVSYSFLIPIIGDIFEIANTNADPNVVATRVVKRLLASGLVTVSTETLTTIIKKIIKRFK